MAFRSSIAPHLSNVTFQLVSRTSLLVTPYLAFSHRHASTSSSKPRRSMLYVPGSNPRMLAKSTTTVADAVCYDLEDSVAHSEKPWARSAVVECVFSPLKDPKGESEKLVRINSVGTQWSDADLEAVVCIVIPKVHSKDEVEHVTKLITKHRGENSGLKLIASIESARAVINLSSVRLLYICTSSPLIQALLFAAEDYCADTGIVRSSNLTPMLYARSAILTHARAFGLQALDLVCVNYKDTEVLQKECKEGKELGYDGKQAVHPLQVETINSLFSPSQKELDRALEILRLNQMAVEGGKGAFGMQGHGEGGREEMIDAPMLLQAERVVEKARRAGMI
ncbi:beta subunit of citrate lyase [Atractiella rhizophila]|nr:beta subunit of citrate lyase [Atractiella rhizophila]